MLDLHCIIFDFLDTSVSTPSLIGIVMLVITPISGIQFWGFIAQGRNPEHYIVNRLCFIDAYFFSTVLVRIFIWFCLLLILSLTKKKKKIISSCSMRFVWGRIWLRIDLIMWKRIFFTQLRAWFSFFLFQFSLSCNHIHTSPFVFLLSYISSSPSPSFLVFECQNPSTVPAATSQYDRGGATTDIPLDSGKVLCIFYFQIIYMLAIIPETN